MSQDPNWTQLSFPSTLAPTLRKLDSDFQHAEQGFEFLTWWGKLILSIGSLWLTEVLFLINGTSTQSLAWEVGWWRDWRWMCCAGLVLGSSRKPGLTSQRSQRDIAVQCPVLSCYTGMVFVFLTVLSMWHVTLLLSTEKADLFIFRYQKVERVRRPNCTTREKVERRSQDERQRKWHWEKSRKWGERSRRREGDKEGALPHGVLNLWMVSLLRVKHSFHRVSV